MHHFYWTHPVHVVTDDAFEAISGLTELRIVDIQSPLFGAKGMESLCTIPSIHSLDLSECVAIPPDSFYLLSRLTRLATLSLTRTKFRPDAISCFCVSSSLTSVSLPSTSVSYLEPLLNCPMLTTLDLTNTNVTDETLHPLTALTSLAFLDLDGLRLTGEGFIGAKYATQLRNFSMLYAAVVPLDSRFTKEGARAIAQFNK